MDRDILAELIGLECILYGLYLFRNQIPLASLHSYKVHKQTLDLNNHLALIVHHP